MGCAAEGQQAATTCPCHTSCTVMFLLCVIWLIFFFLGGGEINVSEQLLQAVSSSSVASSLSLSAERCTVLQPGVGCVAVRAQVCRLWPSICMELWIVVCRPMVQLERETATTGRNTQTPLGLRHVGTKRPLQRVNCGYWLKYLLHVGTDIASDTGCKGQMPSNI